MSPKETLGVKDAQCRMFSPGEAASPEMTALRETRPRRAARKAAACVNDPSGRTRCEAAVSFSFGFPGALRSGRCFSPGIGDLKSQRFLGMPARCKIPSTLKQRSNRQTVLAALGAQSGNLTLENSRKENASQTSGSLMRLFFCVPRPRTGMCCCPSSPGSCKVVPPLPRPSPCLLWNCQCLHFHLDHYHP